jgi:hypothetical protein
MPTPKPTAGVTAVVSWTSVAAVATVFVAESSTNKDGAFEVNVFSWFAVKRTEIDD